jgi:hypothetical protein
VSDEEVRALGDRASRAARTIITGHRAQLEELATTLLANEVIERTDIDRVMQGIPRAAPERRPAEHLHVAAASPTDPAPGRTDVS